MPPTSNELLRQATRIRKIKALTGLYPTTLDVDRETFTRLNEAIIVYARGQNRDFGHNPTLSEHNGQLEFEGVRFVRIDAAS